MAFKKPCPSCGGEVHIRTLRCPFCGDILRNSKSLTVTVDTRLRRKRNAASVTVNRGLETPEKTQKRLKQDCDRACKNRALETPEKTQERKKLQYERTSENRALETPEKAQERKKLQYERTSENRALETPEEAQERKKLDCERTSENRALETPEKAQERKKLQYERTSENRALETPEKAQKRRKLDCERTYCRRSSNVSIDTAIESFISKTKQGPDYVCVACHRLMYRQTVIVLNKNKYTKTKTSLLNTVVSDDSLYASFNETYWICRTCDSALSRGSMPIQSLANNLSLSSVPPELACLNKLETRLVCLRVAFMKMVALPCGKQRCIHGPAVNVPVKLDSVVKTLPRLPEQSQLIPLKFKRKLAYKGHYMYEYVTPENILSALAWLKANHPNYASIEINKEWSKHSEKMDFDLYAGLRKQTVDDNSDGHIELPPVKPIEQSVAPSSLVTTSAPSVATDTYPTVLSTAFKCLETFVLDKHFKLHDVPGDGDCLFWSISYQLNANNLCNTTGPKLRQLVTSYLESHGDYFSGFLAESQPSTNPYNADTEAPGVEDASISTITDSQLQLVARWTRYLDRLRKGAWGDNLCIAAIDDMFLVTINVYAANEHSCNVVTVNPQNGSSVLLVNIGLVMQWHFLGLDVVHTTLPTVNVPTVSLESCVNPSDTVQCTSSNILELCVDASKSATRSDVCDDTESPEFTIDDQTFEEGDELAKQITGGPTASMMSVENPEAFAEIVCLAPGENQKPLFIMTDTNFEAMSNPEKFPYSTGCFSAERPRRLTYQKYFNQRLLNVDGRFASDTDYLFTAQYIVEAKKIQDDCNHFIFRQKPGNVTASQARDDSFVSQCLRKDKAYRFMKNIRGSPPYYQRTFYEMLAMIRQLGTPTWFFTLSAADMKWPDIIQTIARQYGQHYTDDEVAALSFDEKSKWIRRNPVTAARHFQYRLNTFFNEFLKSPAKPLGDYAVRIEFQARGSPHAHCVLWVKDAPKIDEAPISEVCAFIDQYVSVSIPDSGKLRDLVLQLQKHRHSSYCKKKNTCRFKFPHPPSDETLIAEEKYEDQSEYVETLRKVRKVLTESDCDNMTIEDVLAKANVNQSSYKEALTVSANGYVVLLKRNPNECNINNYNPHVLRAWQANMDIQYVLNAYACVMYVASYIMKTDRAMGELLKRVANETRTEDLKTQLKKVGSAFLTHREVSAQEAVYRILPLPMKRMSRTVLFVDTNPKKDRIGVLKPPAAIQNLDDDDPDVFCKNLIQRYQHRPMELSNMCLAEFAANYNTDYKIVDDDTGETDVLPSVASGTQNTSRKITLSDGFGKMNKRGREAIIRFRKHNREKDPSNWYRAKLMLYFPWYSEQTDLLGGYSTFEEHFRNVHLVVIANEKKYTLSDIENIEFDEDGPPQHAWDQVAPSTEANRAEHEAEGPETLTELSEQDVTDNSALFTSTTSSSLHVRYEGVANRGEIPPEEYRKLLRGLNLKQKQIVLFHRSWCKKVVIALKQGKPIEPYRVFVSGPGGVGKTHVIKLIQSDTIKLLRLSGTIEPDDVTVLLTAPTGAAAFIIGGMTLHSALVLGTSKYSGFQPLNHDRLNSLRSKLSKLALLIIDEISMVGSNMLLEVHKRLEQIKAVMPDRSTFGGVSILAVGDLFQLPPVCQTPVFSVSKDSYAKLYNSGSLWVDEFQMIELDEIMRQKGDSAFCELLCRIRTATHTNDDVAVLKSREISPDMPNYPTHALHVYRLNADVDERNIIMLNTLATESQQYSIKACDSRAGQTSHINLSTLSNKRSETGGLHGILNIAIGARVMLTTNIDVADGLVNGARGEIVHVVIANGKVTHILVNFDRPDVGAKARQTSRYLQRFPVAVSLVKHEAIFRAKGKRGSEITRLQFPLTLAWATTIHKVQGLTLDEIVVDMKGSRFSCGQAYVAFSRVKKIEGLHILNFNEKVIKASNEVKDEMARLNDRVLSPLSLCTCPENYTTITLLNVRSLLAKLPDIECDQLFTSAGIYCFTETWLQSEIASPLIHTNHQFIRLDSASGEKKGGVFIALPENIKILESYDCDVDGVAIEMLCTRLQLPNGQVVHLTLVYRSPSVLMNVLLDYMYALLDHLQSSNVISLILGDFNVDILTKTNSQLEALMLDFGYSQLHVHTPTTDNGTLIDHVYCNSPEPERFDTNVADVYYSDHDAVLCSIPL